MKTNNIKNVFVLCTGRCGSVTFLEACKEIENFTSAHESRVRELGASRINYPTCHIEIDNRLSWFLGRLEKKYGSTPLYIHLFRKEEDVVESYNKRWFNRGSIVRAYARGILSRQDKSLSISQDMVQCQLENIESFLSDKKNVLKIDIGNPEEGFTQFWKAINATGNLETALNKLKVAKNTSHQKSQSENALGEDGAEQLDSLEESITRFQHDNKSLQRQILESNAKNRKLEAANLSLKQVNSQQKTRIARITSTKTFRTLAAVKKNLKSPKKWPTLAVELFDILVRNNSASANDNRNRKVNFLVASKLNGLKEAEDFIMKSGNASDLTALNLLKANQSVASDEEWLEHVNSYICSFKLKPISLAAGKRPLFERLSSTDSDRVEYGPLISVIMPAFNSEKTLKLAAESILNQSWKNLELIIINDCSTDRTQAISKELASRDKRVVLLSNRVNVGPYVSKNRGLDIARGEYITGHDADDWALPQRIEMQYLAIVNNKVKGCACAMLRIEEAGKFVRFGNISSSSFDGALRLASISSMFCISFFRQYIGYWDNVRYAADSEVINRASILLGENGFLKLWIPGMLCLESSSSLTNNPTTGVDPNAGLSPIRISYRESWQNWHSTLDANSECRLSFPPVDRQFSAPREMQVTQADIHSVLEPEIISLDIDLECEEPLES